MTHLTLIPVSHNRVKVEVWTDDNRKLGEVEIASNSNSIDITSKNFMDAMVPCFSRLRSKAIEHKDLSFSTKELSLIFDTYGREQICLKYVINHSHQH